MNKYNLVRSYKLAVAILLKYKFPNSVITVREHISIIMSLQHQ